MDDLQAGSGFSDGQLFTNNFIFSFRDRIKYNMAVVVQRLERAVVVRKTRVRLSPSAFTEGERWNERQKAGLSAFAPEGDE